MPEYDSAELEPNERGRIIKSAVTPRPIAWISTTSTDGVDNLAPFSSYNYVSSAEPVVIFNTPYAEGDEQKDTPRNVLETEEFAVNVVTEPLAQTMDTTAASLEADESEFDYAEVDRAECETIEPPRVADAVVTMECTLYDSMRVRDRLAILGDVEYFHVDESVMTDGQIDAAKVDTVGRLGGPYYTVSDLIEFERQF
ncbi:flavin reductase family protein [Natronobacterium texcoconense]|uniref:NADH-FMN oxidoreductase RutF, flavin reductase (DIM6/NTAB) family n=1 Tax=Natronobacterium texcoconense TaxID=1095778 RepID=A0A1H1HTZ8_NATTX|nr:flavin reductase family protein [Natronobacterium texcoconense]SDR28526.1 NADH-FMN oxidoreductase RutF, flavin reductase (DIM6/NTAB) family [Natronobacterium texcoconense]